MLSDVQRLYRDERGRKAGVTFIELLIAVAILGVLVLLASSHLAASRERARIMGIRNDIMLAEGKVGEYLTLNRGRFSNWSLVDYPELETVRENVSLYGADGPVERVTPIVYKQLSDTFVNKDIPSSLPGAFFMNEKGEVYYADVSVDYIFPEYIPPRIVTPDMEIKDGGGWVYADFAYEKNRIIGLSNEGEERLQNGQDNLILPDVNPYTGDTITTVDRNALRHYQFVGDLEGDTIEDVEDSAFRRGQFSGDFIMPHVQYIDSNSFRQSQFTGDFVAPELRVIESFAFHDSEFTGVFDAPAIEYIGTDAFRLSRFVGMFETPNLLFVDGDAFRHSTFSGDFYAPVVETIGQYAFKGSRFTNGQYGNSLPPD